MNSTLLVLRREVAGIFVSLWRFSNERCKPKFYVERYHMSISRNQFTSHEMKNSDDQDLSDIFFKNKKVESEIKSSAEYVIAGGRRLYYDLIFISREQLQSATIFSLVLKSIS
jgi:hypothetical protein